DVGADGGGAGRAYFGLVVGGREARGLASRPRRSPDDADPPRARVLRPSRTWGPRILARSACSAAPARATMPAILPPRPSSGSGSPGAGSSSCTAVAVSG